MINCFPTTAMKKERFFRICCGKTMEIYTAFPKALWAILWENHYRNSRRTFPKKEAVS
jgi:hypothetical protein